MTQALLIMDAQNGIVDRFGAAEAYLDRVVAAQERAEQAGLLVVLVRVAFSPGHPEVSRRNKSFSALAANPGMTLGEPAVEPYERPAHGAGGPVPRPRRGGAPGADRQGLPAPG